MSGPFDFMQATIQEATRNFYQSVDTAVQEALWKRVEHGWKAEPEICTFRGDPLRKRVRIIEDGQIVFQRDVVLRLQSS